MSAEYHIDKEQGLISVRVQDRVDFAELEGLANELLQSADYLAELPLLLDLRGMRPSLGRHDRETLCQLIIGGYRSRTGGVAVVIDPDMSATLSAGVFWLACAIGEAEVFDDYEHALRWLIRSTLSRPGARAATGG